LKKLDEVCGIDSSSSGNGPEAEACEQRNEPSSSTKRKNFMSGSVIISF
jgi:hypothetical protein